MEGSSARHPHDGSGSPKVMLQNAKSPAAFDARLDEEVETAAMALRAQQREDGHWLYDLEADAHATCEELASDCIAPGVRAATSSDGRYHRGDARPRDSSMALPASCSGTVLYSRKM